MSFNSFEYATVFMEELDSQLLDQSTTGWMEENAGQVHASFGKASQKLRRMQPFVSYLPITWKRCGTARITKARL